MNQSKIVRLSESGIMLAFAVVLSILKLVDLPYGGSITICSMLPIALIAYRYGTRWGLLTAFAFSLIQMLDGMKNLQYATSFGALMAIMLLDYIVAFMVLGLCGIFRNKIRSQSGAVTAGIVLACVLRYICHVISGCTVWAGVSIPDAAALWYSIVYNATYMVPETLVCVVGAQCLCRMLDFREGPITRLAPQQKAPDLAVLYRGLAIVCLAVAAIVDIQQIFPCLQNAETGEFDITGIQAVNGPLVAAVTLIGIALAVLFWFLNRRVPADSPVKLGGFFRTIPLLAVAAAAVGVVVFAVNLFASGEALEADDYVTLALLAVGVIAAAWLVIRRALRRKKA